MKATGMKNGVDIDIINMTNFKAHHLECHALETSYSLQDLNVVTNINKKNIWTFLSRVKVHNQTKNEDVSLSLFICSMIEKKKKKSAFGSLGVRV